MYFYRVGRRRARVIRRLFKFFSVSTLFPQIAGGFPQVAAVIHGIIHSLSTRYRA
jgi:hypothetical protein